MKAKPGLAQRSEGAVEISVDMHDGQIVVVEPGATQFGVRELEPEGLNQWSSAPVPAARRIVLPVSPAIAGSWNSSRNKSSAADGPQFFTSGRLGACLADGEGRGT